MSSSASHYLVIVVGDIEPELYGPYQTEDDRDQAALDHREEDPMMEDGIFWLNVDYLHAKTPVEMGAYSGWFFSRVLGEDEDDAE